MFLAIRYTNRARGRGVSLEFDLLWEGRGLGPSRVSQAWRLVGRPGIIKQPLHVEPDRTETGELAFEAHEDWVFDYGDLMEVRVKDHFKIFLRVTDYVSGATLEQPVHERQRS